jgi:outer membrane protein OmpA-like peptidoglycan-associated protein
MPTAPAVGTSGTYLYTPPDLGNYVPRTLVDGTVITVRTASKTGSWRSSSTRAVVPDTTTWFDFDRLLFNTGSATLQPQSKDQLQDIAAILKTYPNAHVKIGGYTDNVGSAASNLALSQERADSVRSQLVSMGVDADRLTAEGYGEENPVGDNST